MSISTQFEEYQRAFRQFGVLEEFIDEKRSMLYQTFPNHRVALIRLTARGPVFQSFEALSGPH